MLTLYLCGGAREKTRGLAHEDFSFTNTAFLVICSDCLLCPVIKFYDFLPIILVLSFKKHVSKYCVDFPIYINAMFLTHY